jgi:hypothetical protein
MIVYDGLTGSQVNVAVENPAFVDESHWNGVLAKSRETTRYAST